MKRSLIPNTRPFPLRPFPIKFRWICFLIAIGWLPNQPLVAQDARSLLGDPLKSPPASKELLEKLDARERDYNDNPSADNLIWLGRFQAYAGDYQQAIDTFTHGIKKFPGDARMYRHRGHRYITTRNFEKALSDFDRAVQLIQNQPNEIEPDGMPNPQNIPISTLHGNIYYHKGLAHYLLGDWSSALKAFQSCRQVGRNEDNQVSAGHWIFSTLQRMGRSQEALQAVDSINGNMKIIENHSYHRICLFYKGQVSENELLDGLENNPAGDSIRYAYANWLQTNGRQSEAKDQLKKLVRSPGWTSFGHIAAEADLARQR